MNTFTSIPQMTEDKQSTFKRWVYEHSDVLYNYSLRHGFDEHSAKDLVQETFLSAWRNMESFAAKASVKTWLFVILKNKIADHFRKAALQISIETLERDSSDNLYFDEHEHWKEGSYPKEWTVNLHDPSQLLDFQKVFTICRGKLKQIHSMVFVMKYVDDLKSETICKQLRITPSNYWVILHRAKVQLRACLEKNWAAKK